MPSKKLKNNVSISKPPKYNPKWEFIRDTFIEVAKEQPVKLNEEAGWFVLGSLNQTMNLVTYL